MSRVFTSPARIVTACRAARYPRATAVGALIMTAACSRTDAHPNDAPPGGVMMAVFVDAAVDVSPHEIPDATNAASDAGRDAPSDGKRPRVAHPAGGMPLTHEQR